MRILNIVTLLLVIIGGLNWGLVGFFDTDLVAAMTAGPHSLAAKIVYGLVGLSALWQLVPLVRAMSSDEDTVLQRHR